MIHLAFENGKEQGLTPLMPLPECTAMSQGYIGYHLQQAIDEQLMRKGSNKPVITMLTQVIVDENDPAFQNPTKPIGSYYDEEAYQKLRQEYHHTYVKYPQGYRRVVASPKPVRIYETVTLMCC
jgi:carbamate kinase